MNGTHLLYSVATIVTIAFLAFLGIFLRRLFQEAYKRKNIVMICLAIALSLTTWLWVSYRGYFLPLAITSWALTGFLLYKSRFSSKAREANINKKSLYKDMSEFADAVQNGIAEIDPTIQAMFQELHMRLDDISQSIEDEDISSEVTDLNYDIERIAYPKGITQKQAEAIARGRVNS